MMRKLWEKPFFLTYVYAVLLLIGASIPTSDLIRIQRFSKFISVILSDKPIHFLGFGLLAWLLCYGYHKAGKTRWLYMKSGMIAVGYGFVIEFIQIPIPFRIFSWNDLAADAAGIALALLLFYIFIGRR
jgi:VanZ family protein